MRFPGKTVKIIKKQFFPLQRATIFNYKMQTQNKDGKTGPSGVFRFPGNPMAVLGR